jgi:multicomponent Na+:H+ antiporter subunit D
VTAVGLAAGIVGVALAVLLAAVSSGLAANPLPRPVRRAGAESVSVLRQLHSGRVGDYAAWLILGSAAVVCTLAVAAP